MRLRELGGEPGLNQWVKRTWMVAVLVLAFAVAVAEARAAPASQTGVTKQLLSREELDALLAPIALYPDSLLSLVLMSSTYPLEVVQADRWLAANKIKSDLLKTNADKQAWDESIKSLAATPEVLTMMSKQLDWTRKLGDAVLAQQADVLDAVQRLRARAHADQKLKSTKEQKVVAKHEQAKPAIIIEQGDPNAIQIPYYDPRSVYGSWPSTEHPPRKGRIAGNVTATGITFGSTYALAPWITRSNRWGGSCNWDDGNLIVSRPINVSDTGANWQHRPEHRHGVRYSNADVQQKFANKEMRNPTDQRSQFRGRGDDRQNRGDNQLPTARTGPARDARDAAFGVQSGSAARLQSARGQASLGGTPGGDLNPGTGPRSDGTRSRSPDAAKQSGATR